MDNRDEIIRTQLEVIGDLINNSMRRVGDDLWGAPPAAKAPEKPEAPRPKAAPAPEKPAEAEELPPPEDIEALKKELNEYIGLAGIKKEVNNLINMVTVYNLRRQHNLPTVEMSLHMVFTGNPGTGKTMIARLMARIYRSLGILSGGQLVEVDRSGLVAGYVGQTAKKTSEVIEKAKGGVLFIDEAYALNSSSENDFGQEAIDTLLKAMEDNREDLVVIVAGYDKLMDDFIHSNPGLESRFNRYLHFEDYTADEMCDIFAMQLEKNKYTLNDDARAAVRSYIEAANTHSISFGNARGVRNIFERTLVAQSNRLAAAENITVEALMAITAEDIAAARSEDVKLNEALRREEELAAGTQKMLDELIELTGAKEEGPSAC
jgi:stage V sporulation protein K